MGEPSLWDRIVGFIGHIGWCLFLWSINMTHEEFIEEIYAAAKAELEAK
jgi:hypothetical protein